METSTSMFVSGYKALEVAKRAFLLNIIYYCKGWDCCLIPLRSKYLKCSRRKLVENLIAWGKYIFNCHVSLYTWSESKAIVVFSYRVIFFSITRLETEYMWLFFCLTISSQSSNGYWLKTETSAVQRANSVDSLMHCFSTLGSDFVELRRISH